MDFALDYTYSMKKKQRDEILHNINQVQLFKRILLLFELVGINRIQYANACVNDEEESAIE